MTAEQNIQKAQQAEVTRKDQRQQFLPAADIWETPDAIEMRLDMPGVDKEHLEIHVEGNTLAVHGSVGHEPGGSSVYAEQRIGDFHREFTLSDDLDTEKITAKMDAGVLAVHIGKAEQVKPRKIEIADR